MLAFSPSVKVSDVLMCSLSLSCSNVQNVCQSTGYLDCKESHHLLMMDLDPLPMQHVLLASGVLLLLISLIYRGGLYSKKIYKYHIRIFLLGLRQ